jgi:hypothetical protein
MRMEESASGGKATSGHRWRRVIARRKSTAFRRLRSLVAPTAVLCLVAASGVGASLFVAAQPAAADSYRNLWNLDPGFPTCLPNNSAPSISAVACAPDNSAPSATTTLVYGQLMYDNGTPGVGWQSGPDILGSVGQNGADPWTSSPTYGVAPAAGDWYANIESQGTSPAASFDISGEPGPVNAQGYTQYINQAQYRSTPVAASANWGGATEMPIVYIPSAPAVTGTCSPVLSGPTGAVTCTASQVYAASSQQSPSYTWTWPDGTTSTGATATGNVANANGKDGQFSVTLSATADNLTSSVVVNSNSSLCLNFTCMNLQTVASPDGTSSDPATWPSVGQPETLTTTVTNTLGVPLYNLTPAALNGSQYQGGTVTPTPPSVAEVDPGQSTTFTWPVVYANAGQDNPDLHIDAATAAGRAVYGDQYPFIHVATGPIVVNSTGDAGLSATATAGVCDTGQTVADGNGNQVAECTLRAAIQTIDNNTDGTAQNITFNIPGSGVQHITPASPLPAITATTAVDGSTQPGAAPGVPAIWIDDAGVSSGDGLDVDASDVNLNDLEVSGSSAADVNFQSGDNGSLTASVVGTSPDGLMDPDTQAGVQVEAEDITIGGAGSQGDVIDGIGGRVALPTSPNATNLGTVGAAVWVSDGGYGTNIEGDTLGAQQGQSGSPAPNAIGVLIAGASNQPGDTTISNDTGFDILGVLECGYSSGGCAGAGSLNVSNSTFQLDDGSNAQGAGVGVMVLQQASPVDVESDTFTGARIGVFGVGLEAYGLTVDNTTVTGGIGVMSVTSSGLTITNNTFSGTSIGVTSLGGIFQGYPNTISGNQFGAGAIMISADGADQVSSNQFSGNIGMIIDGAPGIQISGNTLQAPGPDPDTTSVGILMGASPGATVTGSTVSGANVGLFTYAGGDDSSIGFNNSQAPLSSVTPTAITSDISGAIGSGNVSYVNDLDANALGNDDWSSPAPSASAAEVIQGNTFTGNGNALVATGLPNIEVGGTGGGQGNTFTGNLYSTVIAAGGGIVQGNSMSGNDIHLNDSGFYTPAIATSDGSVAGTADASPVVTAAYPSSEAATTITGTLNASPSSLYTIDVYSDASSYCTPSGRGGLGTWLGQVTVSTDGTGAATWTFSTTAGLTEGQIVSATSTGATATTTGSGTSEPSPCTQVTVATTTTQATSPGQTEVPVADNSQFTVGDQVVVDPNGPDPETDTISGFGSIILQNPLQFSHPAGALVVELFPAPTSTQTSPTTVSVNGPSTEDVGDSYGAVATADGSPAPTFTLASGAPSWLAVNSTTGSVSGTVPSGITSFTYSVTATNATGNATSIPVTVDVDSAPTTVSVNGQSSVDAGSGYTATASADGNPAPGYSLANGAPGWLSIDANSGAVTGTVPAGITSFSYSVTATNSVGSATSSTVTVPVNSAPTTVTVVGLSTVDAGGAYAANASADGNPAPSYSLASGAPSWLSIISASGAVSGTVPSGITSFTYSVTATNAAGDATSSPVTVTVDSAPTTVTVSGGPSTIDASAAYTATASADGNPAPGYSLASGAPSWLSVNASSGALTGTVPTAITSFTYKVTATNAAGHATSSAVTVTVDSAPTAVTVSGGPSTVDAGAAYSATASGNGNPTPDYSLASGGPSWLSVNATTGALTGTVPTGITSFTYKVTATNGVGSATSSPVSVTVDVAPTTVTVSGGPTTIDAGSAYSATASGNGNPAPTYSLVSGAPSWLSVNASTGALTGAVPSGITSFSYSVKATNAAGSATSPTVTVAVDSAPSSVSVTSSTTATVGEAYAATALGNGNPAPTYSLVSGAPSWLLVNATTGAISGNVPTGITSFTYSVKATDGVGSATSSPVVVTVSSASTTKPVFVSASSTDFSDGKASTFTVTASGTPAPSVTGAGTLPNGVKFTSGAGGTGTIAGTPTQSGTFTLTLKATNSVGSTAQVFTLVVQQSPAFTSAASVTLTVGVAHTFAIATSGYPAATVTEAGALPLGVHFSSGTGGTATLAGTPANGTGGRYSVTLQASNGVGAVVTQSFSLVVDQKPAITSSDVELLTHGKASSFVVTTAGYPAPSIGEIGPLPPGLSFKDNGNGTATVSGTPTRSGIYLFAVDANNTSGTTTQLFLLLVD